MIDADVYSYLFTFGWALLLTALVIGLATAVTISAWTRENLTCRLRSKGYVRIDEVAAGV